MRGLSKKVTERIWCRLCGKGFGASSRTEPRRFTRKRKLSFVRCMVLILDRLTRSLKQELREMFEGQELGDAPTEQAFSKARQGIKPEAFKELFEIERDEIGQSGDIRRYQGYRVFGIDGSDMLLPGSADLRATYPDLGKEKNRCPHARASLLRGLLDGYVLDAQLTGRSVCGRKLAQAHLDALEGVLILALYALRWGVETAYGRIKNQLGLEKFSGRSAIAIQQEFYGAMFLLNFAVILATEAVPSPALRLPIIYISRLPEPVCRP